VQTLKEPMRLSVIYIVFTVLLALSPLWAQPLFDLNGTWEWLPGTPGDQYFFHQTFLIVQIKSEVAGINLEGHPFVGRGQEFLIGSYSSPKSIRGGVRAMTPDGRVILKATHLMLKIQTICGWQEPTSY
jgi:hypothetical protein